MDRNRGRESLALALLVLLPLGFLWPVVFGHEELLPWDPARFPPQATVLPARELEAIRAWRSNMDVTEIPVLVLPQLRLAHDELRAGRLPGWNPYARLGTPLLAHSHEGLFYPPNWLLLASQRPEAWLGVLTWLALATAGVLTFLLLRDLGLAPGPSLAGAVAFALGGTVLANAAYLNRVLPLTWLPGMLWAAQRTARGQRLGGGLLLALFVAATWLAGFPPHAAVCTLVLALWCVPLLVGVARADGVRPAAQFTLAVGCAGLLGLGLAGAQLVPLCLWFPESNRALLLPAREAGRQAFDPMGLLGLLMPAAFGHPDAHSTPPYAWSPWAWLLWSRCDLATGRPLWPHNYDSTEYTVFPGTLVLLLAVVGAVRGRVRGLGLAALAALLFTVAMVPAWLAPLYEPAFLRQLQPMRCVAPVSLLIAALAAHGFAGLDQTRGGARTGAWLAGLLAAACLTLGWLALCGDPPLHERCDLVGTLVARHRPGLPDLDRATVLRFLGEHLAAGDLRMGHSLVRAGLELLVAAVLFALVPVAQRRGAVPWLRAVIAALTLAQLLVLARELVPGRVLAQPPETPVHRFLAEQRDRHAAQGGITVARASAVARTPSDLPAGTLMPARIRDLNAFAFADGRSHLLFERLWGPGQMFLRHWPNAFPDDARLAHPILDLLGLRYLLSTERLTHAGAVVGPTLTGPGGEFFVYERTTALPRAFVVPTAQVVESDDAALEHMLRTDFDPRGAVLVDPAAAATLSLAAPAAGPGAARAVEFVLDLPDQIQLRVAAGSPGFLVLVDAWMPGWSAQVEGRPVPLVRGDLCLRVVPVSGARQDVVLRYDPPGLTLGTLVCLASVVLLGAGVVRRLRRRRTTAGPPPATGAPAP